MKKKYLAVLFFLIFVISGGLFYYFNWYRLICNEREVILEGKLITLQDKYLINAIETNEGVYWMYGPPANFDDFINKTVRIVAILSPAYNRADPLECNICYRECNTCQCPLYQELLYDAKILNVLD